MYFLFTHHLSPAFSHFCFDIFLYQGKSFLDSSFILIQDPDFFLLPSFAAFSHTFSSSIFPSYQCLFENISALHELGVAIFKIFTGERQVTSVAFRFWVQPSVLLRATPEEEQVPTSPARSSSEPFCLLAFRPQGEYFCWHLLPPVPLGSLCAAAVFFTAVQTLLDFPIPHLSPGFVGFFFFLVCLFEDTETLQFLFLFVQFLGQEGRKLHHLSPGSYQKFDNILVNALQKVTLPH